MVNQCQCGCGQETSKTFFPGHDQKLRIALERSVGGLITLKTLIELIQSFSKGEITDESFLEQIRSELS